MGKMSLSILLAILAYWFVPTNCVRSLDDLHPVLAPLLFNAQQYIDSSVTRDLDSLEFMSGQAEITKAYGKLGAKCVGFDKSYADWDGCNINTPTGFNRAMSFALRVKRHGSVWAAPVCASWIWIARSGSGRSAKTPGGDTGIDRVRDGNMMVVRLVMIFLVCWARGVHLWLENPMSTIIHEFSPLKELLLCIMPFKVTTEMSAYGTEVSKPLMFWSSCKAVMSLYRQPVKVTQTLCTRNQNGGVTGKRAALKLSQAYPPDFGKAVARIFALIRKRSSFDDLLDSDLCCGLEVMSKGTKRTNTKQRTEGKRTERTSTTKQVKRKNTKQAKRTKRTNTKCTNTKISENVLDFFLTLA